MKVGRKIFKEKKSCTLEYIFDLNSLSLAVSGREYMKLCEQERKNYLQVPNIVLANNYILQGGVQID